MDNITKFLQWSVGLLITLAIISTGLLLWNKAQPIGSAAQQQAAEQARLMSEAQFAAYDNQVVSGSQLLTAYRRYYTLDAFHLYVQTSRGGTQQFGMTPSAPNGGTGSNCPSFDYANGKINGGTTTCSVKEADVTTVTHSYYVPPQARFRTTVVKDGNDRIAGIYFKMQ
ncbi:hypothetical protein PAECIP111893_02765 [Paenibacillus plantiphilus]|uniref:Uncharacterized protein n=1 Tax=Paenibacillus plantiphilus TaxID=2905650 RepID=A0ABM9CAN2_9BACL|nr:hypothetical protein [Paenibacillus plantiphilus]CAH1207728.1 hypothetical protein PAECIP111893_02765 [Paenibacillus plantiphilus]